MSPAAELASQEGFLSESERRKRLGQYFTGTGLGRVLAALAEADKANTVIDPMSGTGDLLVACAELGVSFTSMGAVDIDPIALHTCGKRLPDVDKVLGNAFDPKVLKRLPHLQWDLVIANPPYVRYQSISKSAGKGFPLPGTMDVRNGLLSEIDMLPSLDEMDKKLFKNLVTGYSGLSDLAVPSWILCAGLVAPGGRLALVVPESWLSRDYAAVVHYLLLRWFEIEFVVEDEHATWFSDAQVKTTLLVAKRVSRREGAFDFLKDQSFVKIAVSGKASGPLGACSRLMRGKSEPEKSFARDARQWLSSGRGYEDDMIRAYHVSIARVASNLRSICTKQKWFAMMGEISSDTSQTTPHELDEWLSRSSSTPPLISLSCLNVSVGQGLRTGANAFFYAEMTKEGAVTFEKLLPGEKFQISDEIALPVLRKQADLPSGFVVEKNKTVGRVLDLRRHALPEDIDSGGEIARTTYHKMPSALEKIVRAVSLAEFGDEGSTKRIWELSAVAPNIRKAKLAEGTPPRFWYMLPDFARRHRPDILIARVNTGTPKAYLNKDAECVIDANFSTLWTDGIFDKYALLALLNSAWAATALEFSAAVMGGGALKVEATHLRRLPVPPMDNSVIHRVAKLGRMLAGAKTVKSVESVIEEIDHEIASAALGRKSSVEDVIALRGLAATGRTKRKKQKTKE